METPQRQPYLEDLALVEADYKMLCAEEDLRNAEGRAGSPESAGQPPVSGGVLILNTGNVIDNAGLLEATAGGELDVKDS